MSHRLDEILINKALKCPQNDKVWKEHLVCVFQKTLSVQWAKKEKKSEVFCDLIKLTCLSQNTVVGTGKPEVDE